MRHLIALLCWLEFAAYRLRIRLHYPQSHFVRCRICGGRTAMKQEQTREAL